MKHHLQTFIIAYGKNGSGKQLTLGVSTTLPRGKSIFWNMQGRALPLKVGQEVSIPFLDLKYALVTAESLFWVDDGTR